MKQEKWNSNDYQGKRKDQVEGANYGCVVSGVIIVVLIGFLIVEQLIKQN